MSVEHGVGRDAAVSLLLACGKRTRLAMRGTSMLPLLREPMVLDVEAAARVRFGDVLVFRGEDRVVAHRVIRRLPGAWITAGDAQSWCERVPDSAVLGRVVAVRSNADPGSRRVDTALWRARGRAVALHRLGVVAARSLRRRACGPTAFGALIEALLAARSGDRARFVAACESVPAAALHAVALRHRCAGILEDARRRVGLDRCHDELARARWGSVLRFGRYASAVAEVVRALQTGGVRFALLKGAARTYAAESNADLHLSADIDVLVDPDDVDAARRALAALGYATAASHDLPANHHHEVPLVAPDRPDVELHTALAPPAHFTMMLDARTMLARTRVIEGAAGPALVLDDVASVLHLCVHAFAFMPLRDLVIAGELLARLGEDARAAVMREIDGERLERTRVRAALVVAGALGGVPIATTRRVRRYVAWVVRREQLPRWLHVRAHVADAIAARAPVANGWYGTSPVRVLGKLVLGPLLVGWARALPESVPATVARIGRP